MEICNYVARMINIQHNLSEYIENTNYSYAENQDIINLFNDQTIYQDHYKLKSVLYLLSRIAKNHHRSTDFFAKFENIFHSLGDEIKKNFTNSEIFNIFKTNKRLLLLLIKEKILTIDQTIANQLVKGKYKRKKYHYYFYSEIKFFIDEVMDRKITKKLDSDYENNREIGENDSYLCELIRKDLIDQFVIYANQINLPLSSEVKKSIFETNSFLLDNKPTLIEYATFFGSIQIFQYLRMNDVKLTPSLWLYAIHSNNAEIVHLLQEDKVEPEDKSYKKVLKEAINCHHNEVANYIINNLLMQEKSIDNNDFNEKLLSYAFHYYNFEFFPKDFNHKLVFHYLCQFDYFELVKHLINTGEININEPIN